MTPTRLATVSYRRASEAETAFELARRFSAQGFKTVVSAGPHDMVTLESESGAALSHGEASEYLRGLEARIRVRFKRIRPNATLPSWGSLNAAGLDLHACLDAPLTLRRGESRLIPIGWSFECPKGAYGRIAPRSGMSMRGFFVNAGVVDADFRGEVNVLLTYMGPDDVQHVIGDGDRVAQLIFERCVYAQAVESLELDDSDRGTGGWGSTGF